MRVFLTLRTQRQMLILGIVALAVISIILAAALFHDRETPEIVKLGKGLASVDAQPVRDLEPRAPANVPEPVPSPSESGIGNGRASFYGNELAGNRTASGEIFDPKRLTAAHRTLPLGSRVRVTNARNGKSVIVRINDRGPFHGNRVIDISTAAARTIGLIRSGTGRVNLALLVS
ncbi:septal ring lytic transglycosylase RlpA family protein [Novosphingobium sp. PC22D]|uniref:septal ring lytic transglycosylase RlpA family protein n=1 Tax=Novosphingobium sp. PC22D TaxID=1962403 RepID=UPI001F0A357C|nr:septal ring lytic transglycosylase RlpA family protein [Novosphingobium sp. PC22D]